MKGNEAIKHRVIRHIRKLFDQEKENDKPVRIGKFWNENYGENLRIS